jgi:hypothetical protein
VISVYGGGLTIVIRFDETGGLYRKKTEFLKAS